jgi:hypothetical protein
VPGRQRAPVHARRPAGQEDLRHLPLGDRKAKLSRLLAGSSAGIVFNEHTDEDGPTGSGTPAGSDWRASCQRLAAPYRSGPSRDWIKVKNPTAQRCGGRARGCGNSRIMAEPPVGAERLCGDQRVDTRNYQDNDRDQTISYALEDVIRPRGCLDWWPCF